MAITEQQLGAIMPDALAGNRTAVWVKPLNDAMERFGITGKMRCAMFLGNLAVESGELKAREENLRYSADRLRQVFPGMFRQNPAKADELVAGGAPAIANFIYDDANRPKGARLGNVNPGDGFKFRGRGPLQITGRDNYVAFFKSVGMPANSDPDFLLLPDGGSVAAGHYWQSHGCNDFADAGDFEGCVAAINSASEGLERRRAFFNQALATLPDSAIS